MNRFFTAAVLALVASVVAGCATTTARPGESTPDPRSVAIVRGEGAPATWSELVQAAADADVVLIGENHGHALGLAAAAALWEDVLAGRPSAVLSLEFFERDQQLALDDYLSGLTDEAAFRAASARTDSNYPPGHRAMVESARAASRPVVAANAPRRYVRLARREGYERLLAMTPDQRRMFRVPDVLPTGPYRDRFDRVMTPPGREPDTSSLDAVFRSQSLWDWTMADSVAGALSDKGSPVVLVVGRFHSDHEGGTLLALRRIVPGVRALTVSFVDAAPFAADPGDLGRADFMLYVGPFDRPKNR
ncbi:MAG: ChaN family lipoprotein [Phycisphaeraceae bacterium]|nr:ChaN family lipoprotein [Phycisphaerae bacterium]MBX3392839.1 ChaN family lipoprotein [Phycisphaeraceae bacterium]